MPDLPHSVHLSPFDYADDAYQCAAAEAKSRSLGRCQECGRKLPLEAHHWALGYPPAGKTTADDLTGLCRDCHDGASEKRVYLAAGGCPERLRATQSEAISGLLRPVDDGRRVGWAVQFQRRWAAIVTGQSRPHVGEVFWLFLFWRREWVTVAVTDVVDGRPGHWRVRKQFLPARDEVRLPASKVPPGSAIVDDQGWGFDDGRWRSGAVGAPRPSYTPRRTGRPRWGPARCAYAGCRLGGMDYEVLGAADRGARRGSS